MKRIKKIALLLIVVILSTTFNVHATNQTNAISLSTSAIEIKAGDTVTITISAQCETGVSDFNAALYWDATKLQLDGIQQHEYYTNLSGKEGEKQYVSILYGDMLGNAPEQNPTEVNDFVKLQFKVSDTVVAAESLSIKLAEIEFYDANSDEVTVEDKEITLTVAGNEGAGNEGAGNEGAGNEGAGNEGAGNEGAGNEGAGNEGAGNEGAGNEGAGNEGAGNEGAGNEGAGDEGEKDNTTADKEFNKAGLETYTLMAIVAVVSVAIVLNTKCKKYKDVK